MRNLLGVGRDGIYHYILSQFSIEWSVYVLGDGKLLSTPVLVWDISLLELLLVQIVSWKYYLKHISSIVRLLFVREFTFSVAGDHHPC